MHPAYSVYCDDKRDFAGECGGDLTGWMLEKVPQWINIITKKYDNSVKDLKKDIYEISLPEGFSSTQNQMESLSHYDRRHILKRCNFDEEYLLGADLNVLLIIRHAESRNFMVAIILVWRLDMLKDAESIK